MQKVAEAVAKETKYIAVCTLIMSVIMQIIFVVLGKWTYRVLLGNILSSSVMIVNFFLMGLSVQKAVSQKESDARKTIKNSQSLRTLFLFLFVMLGVILPCFSGIATIIPLFFQQIAVMIRPLWKDKQNEKEVSL